MSRILALIMVAVLVVIDQASKYAAVTYLRGAGTYVLIPGILGLTYAENHGAAFGIMQGARWFFVIFTIIVLGFIAYYYEKMPPIGKLYPWTRLTLLLIAGGALGNFIDRLRYGFVVDFFHILLFRFPIFNFADIFIVVGAFGLSIIMLFADGVNKSSQNL